jgi:heme A synthase
VTRNPGTTAALETHPAVRALALCAVALTIVLITVGGLVTNTDSGLACPDWPTCFGTPFPKLVGGVLMEHGHRYLATAVGFVTVLLVIGTRLKKPASMIPSLLVAMPLILVGGVWAGAAKHQTGAVPALAGLLVLAGYGAGIISIARARGAARLAEFALLLVITQGLLGGATVMYQLPVTILILHLGTSMLFLAVLVWLFVSLEPRILELAPAASTVAQQRLGARVLLPLSTAAVYLQILIGASVRHTGAGLICTEWLCRGALWPMGAELHPAVHLHMLHRAFALVVFALVVWTSVRVLRDALHANDRRAAALGLIVPLLLLAQLVLGVATIATLKEMWVVTAHLLVAALILSALTCLWARAARAAALSAPTLESP